MQKIGLYEQELGVLFFDSQCRTASVLAPVMFTGLKEQAHIDSKPKEKEWVA